jgi:hypothetical protein
MPPEYSHKTLTAAQMKSSHTGLSRVRIGKSTGLSPLPSAPLYLQLRIAPGFEMQSILLFFAKLESAGWSRP